MAAKKGKQRSKRIIGAKYFPFPTARPGQERFMEDISRALREGRRLVAHAPTGIGKTVAVLTTAAAWSRAKNKKLFFLTSKQSQHTIAVDTLRAIGERMRALSVVDIISRERMCPEHLSNGSKPLCQSDERYDSCRLLGNDNLSAVEHLLSNILHVEEVVEFATEARVCPYRAALDAAQECDVIVCDYNYVFSSIRDVILARLGIEPEDMIIIVDEAHNLPDRIRENMSVSLSLPVIEKAARQCVGEYEQLGYYIKDVGQVLSDLHEDATQGRTGKKMARRAFPVSDTLEQVGKELSEYADEKNREGPWELERDDLVKRLNYLVSSTLSGDQSYNMGVFMNDLQRHVSRRGLEGKDSNIHHLMRFLGEWMDESTGKLRLCSEKNGPILEVYQLDPGEMGKEIFRRVSGVILMSGTLFPGKMYVEILGMDLKKCLIRHYTSPFPPSNKLVVGMNFVTTLYRKREKTMFQAIANQIQEVSKYARGNIAAFFPSYKLLSHIHVHLKRCFLNKPILLEKKGMTKREKGALMGKLRELKEGNGAILFAVQGGSLSEGVDYCDNLLDGILIVGLPLKPPTVKARGLVRYYTRRFGRSKGYYYSYVHPAINKVLQASGRAIRGYRDWVFVILMDHRFGMVMYKKRFPQDFDYSMMDDVHGRIEEFLEDHGKTDKKIYEEEDSTSK